jgi:RNA polymerase sigma factor (sigma-70 family)
MLKKDLAGLDDRALLGIVRLLPRASERRVAACEVLVTRHQGLVRSCVRRYISGPESAEDLMQVGYVGLLKAINNFDPAMCRSLATYALPCISGEIERHFRDKRWQIRVKRPVQELVLEVREATWRLTQELGRTPTESDMARHLGMTQTEIGRRLRISQMHVSRLRTHALGYLRSRLLDLEGTRANADPAASATGCPSGPDQGPRRLPRGQPSPIERKSA